MSANCFVDTNILVYFRDASEPEKQTLAAKWLTGLWRSRTGKLSFQVLNEYYVTVTQRLTPGLKPEAARADVRNLLAWNPIRVDRMIIEAGWIVQDRYHLSWWDSLIVAAAQAAGCDYLLSEDLQHQQQFDGMYIVNPFMVSPDRIPEYTG